MGLTMTLDRYHISEIMIGMEVQSLKTNRRGVIVGVISEYPISYFNNYDTSVSMMSDSRHWVAHIIWNVIDKVHSETLGWEDGKYIEVLAEPRRILDPIGKI